VRRFLRTRLALLHKEWRDVRALTIACALLVPIGLISMEYGYLDWRGDFTAGTYVPTCIGLFLAVIAADLIAADIATKRARAYAALPTRWAGLWVSKLAFLAVAGVSFTIWTVTSCAAVYAALAPDAANAQFIEQLSRLPREYVYAGVFGAAAVVFWSTVLERGFAVVGAAVITCAVIGGTLPLLHWINPELLPDDETVATASMVLPLVFLAGSLHAFVRTPQHSSSVWRRFATAAILPLVVLVPTGAVSAAVLSQRLVVETGDPRLQLALGHVSPDGRRVVVLAKKRHERASTRTWILDLEDGSLAVLEERNLRADWRNAWTADGAYKAWASANVMEDELRRLYDPETGAVLETRSAEQVGHDLRYPFVDWATTRREHGDLVATVTATGREFRRPEQDHIQFSKMPGYVLHTDADGVHLLDLNEGTSRVLRTADGYLSGRFSPTGAYVSTWAKSGHATYNTRTGNAVACTETGYPWFPGGGSDDRFAVLWGDTDKTLVDLESGEHYPATLRDSGNPSSDLRVLSDHRVIRLTNDGRVEVRDLDGGNRRTVYAPRREN